MSSLEKYRAEIYALFAYLLLALGLTFPLILNVASHVPGDGSDDPALAWNLWWVPYSIIHLGKSPIYTDSMFYPIGLNLAFYTLTYLNAFVSIPFQYALNVVVAANMNVWLSFVLSGFGAYVLMKYLLRASASPLKPLAAFAAGAVYAFSSNKFLYASLGQFNIASSHWIPFYVLFLLKWTKKPTLPDGFWLGLFLLFQAWSEFIYASFLILFTAIYLVAWCGVERLCPAFSVRHLASFLIAVLVFTLPMSPMLAAMIQDMLTEGDFLQSGLGFADVFSTDVLGFFVPSHLHPIFGNLAAHFDFAYINFAYLGFVALTVAMIALSAVPRARIWGIFGLIFAVISLGPHLTINGTRYDLPMPFDLLLEIPFVKGNRYPSRWSVMVTLALAVLVGYGLGWLLDKLSRWRNVAHRKHLVPAAYGLLLTALLFEHWSLPLPLSNLTIPDAYQTIAQDQGDFTVLEIPLAWRNGFRMTGPLDQAMMFAQFYQTAHRHPILGGNTSRNPELKFQYFTEAPVINSIIAVETGHRLDRALLERDRQRAPHVLRFLGVRYIVWHSPRNPANRANLDAARAYVQYVLPVTKIAEMTDDTGETVVFRVNDLPVISSTTVQPGNDLARLNFAEGWGALSGERLVWAQRREAKIFVRLDTPPRDARLELSASAPPGLQEQPTTILVNGHRIGQVVLTPCLACKTGLPIPFNVLRAGMNEIVFQFEHVVPAMAFRDMASTYLVSRNGPLSPVNLVVRSAGSEVGDFAHIYVNGVEASPNRRGYNIVVIDPAIGTVEARAAFDTFASADESVRMAQFIEKIAKGKIVAVAVRDEASRNLTLEGVNALRSIGAAQDLRGKWRWSHALIGAKGMPPGSVWEAAFETMPAQLVLGIGATEPKVAAAIEWIKIE